MNKATCDTSQCADAISVAAQMGRLDLISALLALIGIALVLAGVFAFMHFRDVAKKTACEESEKHAKIVAERVANEYIQQELPALLEAYKGFIPETEFESDNSKGSEDLPDQLFPAQED